MFSSQIKHARHLLRLFGKLRIRKHEKFVRLASGGVATAEESRIETSATVEKTRSGMPKTNKPFTRELFLGRFDPKILVYPEIADTDELITLNEMVQPIEKFFNELDSKSIDENAKLPDDVLQQLKDFGLFGQQIPQEYGGLGLDATKFARIAEVTALDGSIAVTLAGHQTIGLKGILLFGTEEQKRKYLPKLATGEHVAAFCLTEPGSGSDAASIKTRATLSEDGKSYLLNGGKIWITNGGIADIFTVFAKTETENERGEKEDRVTAFIVERAFGGISNGKPEDKLGIRGSNTCEVFFDNTPVPVENVIGEVGGGFKVAMNILNSGRFSMGSSGAGGLKKLLAMTIEHVINRQQFGKKLYEFELIQEKIAKMTVSIYAMESMAYLTAGIIDAYEEPDCALEAALVKVYSSEGVWYSVNECLQILGGMGYMKDYPFERYLRDSRILPIFEGTNEILRLLVAMSGLQYAGKDLLDLVRRTKDPLNNVGFIFSAALKRLLTNRHNPKLTLNLHEHVHQNLVIPVQLLEKSVLKFYFVVEALLAKYQEKMVDRQMDLRRLADMAMDMYAMAAVVGRASRSISIGLRNCDHEVMLAYTFCFDASERIERNMKELAIGDTHCLDENYKRIAMDIVNNEGYAAEHPLTKNW